LSESSQVGSITSMTRELASESAHRVASYLKTFHGATRVVLFGSVLKSEFRADHSDIDLYFEGVPYDREMTVTGMTFCAFPDLKLDLFPAGHATRDLIHEVQYAGVSL